MWEAAVWPVALIAATVARPADKDMAFEGCLVVGEVLVQMGLVYCCKPRTQLFPFHADVVNAAANPTAGLWSAARSGSMDPRFQSVSGGRGANTNAANQYVISDGFEALHVRRLKHVWQHLTERLDAVEDSARELATAVALADVDDEIPARSRPADTPTPLQSRRSTPRTEAARTAPRAPRRDGAAARNRRRRGLRREATLRGGGRAGHAVGLRAPEDRLPAADSTSRRGAAAAGRGDGRPPRQDGGSAPVSRRSSTRAAASQLARRAPSRDEGTVRGDGHAEAGAAAFAGAAGADMSGAVPPAASTATATLLELQLVHTLDQARTADARQWQMSRLAMGA